MNKVDHNFQLNAFQCPVNVDYMIATVFHELCLVIIVHRDNNLFPRRALHDYIDFQFGLAFAIDNFLNVFNFLCLEIQENLFDLEDFSGIDGWLKRLSIQFSLTLVVQS